MVVEDFYSVSLAVCMFLHDADLWNLDDVYKPGQLGRRMVAQGA